MGRGIFYTMIGYVSGSVLYAKVFGKLFCQKDVTEDTIDGNPGTTKCISKWRNMVWHLHVVVRSFKRNFAGVCLHAWTAGGRYLDYVCAGSTGCRTYLPGISSFSWRKRDCSFFRGAAWTLSIYETSAAAGMLFSLILLCDCDHAELS